MPNQSEETYILKALSSVIYEELFVKI